MATEIVVALITGACAVIGQWMISQRNRQNDIAERARREAEEDARLRAIESRLDSHNAYAMKFEEVSRNMNELTVAIVAIQKDVEYLKERAE